MISNDDALIEKHSEPSEIEEEPEPEAEYPNYAIKYLISLLINALLLDLYVVQIYSEHVTCLTQEGANSTRLIKQALLLGLAPLIADIVVSNICSIYYRSKATRDAELTKGMLLSKQFESEK